MGGEIKELEAELDFNLICREEAVLLEPHFATFYWSQICHFLLELHTPLRGNRRLSTIQQKDTRYSTSQAEAYFSNSDKYEKEEQ